MAKCPKCGAPGHRVFGGFCTRVHRDLSKKARVMQYECARCGESVTRLSSQVKQGAKVYCKKCPKNSGETHPRWKEGQHINAAGYRLILVHGEYKPAHRHTWEQANRSCLLPEGTGKMAIHHINMIKTDNRPQNLVLLTSQIHGRIHRLFDAGRYEEASCILKNCLMQQLFFAEHSEHIERIASSYARGSLDTI